MKKLYMIPIAGVLLAAIQASAGNLTVAGNLSVSSNLTAQSITLGGVTQTNWSFLPLQGAKYVIVAEGTNDTQRGSNLAAAYATATTLGPNATNRVTVLVPPGQYNLGATGLVMNTSCVDLIGLVPAQMTTKQVVTDSHGTYTKTVADIHCPATLYSAATGGTVQQSVQDTHIESVILQNTGSIAYGDGEVYWNPDYAPTVDGTSTVLKHVAFIGPGASMPISVNYAGTYIDCAAGGGSFGGSDSYYSSGALGTFIDCVAGDASFGGDTRQTDNGGPASGTFIGCTAGDYSFAASDDCSGMFINCVAGIESFGSEANGNVNGTLIQCVGGDNCFAGDSGALNTGAKLQHCRATGGSFGGFNMASDDFNYNVGGANTFLMLPQLPTSTNGLPSGAVYNSSGTLKIVP